MILEWSAGNDAMTYLPDKGRPHLVVSVQHVHYDGFKLAELPGKVRPQTILPVLLPRDVLQ